MLVAIVVPWNTWSSADGSWPASAAISRMPDGSCRGILRRRRQLVDADHPGLVVDEDQVGERSADVDSKRFIVLPSGLEDDLAEVLAALHHRHRLARVREGERLVDERRDLPVARELETALDLGAVCRRTSR